MAQTNFKNKVNIKSHNGTDNGLMLGDVLVTATAAELNALDGVLASTAEINRAADNSTRVVNVTTTPLTVTEALHDKKFITLNKADGITATLPAATGSGAVYEFFVGTTVTSNGYIIKVADATDIMMGYAILGQDSADTVVQFDCAADSDTITLDGSTTGGLKGARVIVKDVATNLLHVEVISSATGSEATPFSATVA